MKTRLRPVKIGLPYIAVVAALILTINFFVRCASRQLIALFGPIILRQTDPSYGSDPFGRSGVASRVRPPIAGEFHHQVATLGQDSPSWNEAS